MDSTIADGAVVPGAEAAEVDEVREIDEGAAAGAEGAGEEGDDDGEGEAVTDPDGDGEAEEAQDDHKLSPRAQEALNKRIGALTAKRKAAEEERDALKAERDEQAARLERLGDAATVRAAEAAGVLPELVGKDEAQRIAQHAESKRSVEFFGDWLEDNTEPDAELDLEGRKYTRGQVKEFKRQHQRKLEGLDDVPALQAKLRKESGEILRLGLAARKAGWKPGAAAAGAAAAEPGKAKPKLPTAPAGARTALPAGAAKPRPGAGTAPKRGAIRDEDDLALAIERGELG